MSVLLKDLRFGFRMLGKHPGFSLVAVLVLGLGIGANAAVFSVVNALLFKPLPGADSGTALLGLFGKDTTRPDRYRPFSYPNYVDIRDGVKAFSSIAAQDVALALVGIYGVNSYVVTRRTREIGIRMALGATSRDVVRLILRDAAIVSVTGIVVGLGLAVALGTLLSSMLYGVGAADPLALVAAPLLLGASALLASYIPARRATRIAPVTALRHD